MQGVADEPANADVHVGRTATSGSMPSRPSLWQMAIGDLCLSQERSSTRSTRQHVLNAPTGPVLRPPRDKTRARRRQLSQLSRGPKGQGTSLLEFALE